MGCMNGQQQQRIQQKRNKKILIVDDETDIALTLKLALESGGFEVETFYVPDLALASF